MKDPDGRVIKGRPLDEFKARIQFWRSCSALTLASHGPTVSGKCRVDGVVDRRNLSHSE